MGKIIRLFHKSAILCIFLLAFSHPANAVETGIKKAVLVTGANSGIGRKITIKLTDEGFYVYAGARKKKDLEALDRIPNVKAVRLDVTIQDEIDRAVELVKSDGRALYGIVNNAGVLSLGSLLEAEASELEFVFGVNVYGPYRITKAFAPMIIKSQGRVINISSISGVLSSQLAGIYSMSKHAVEAYTDSLDQELSRVGARAIAIEPGTYDSKIFNNLCKRLPEKTNDESMLAIAGQCEDLPEGDVPNNRFPQPDRVADAVFDALSAAKPKDHYMVVPSLEEAQLTISKAIEELVSLNEDNKFSFSRDELIEVLDEELVSRAE